MKKVLVLVVLLALVAFVSGAMAQQKPAEKPAPAPAPAKPAEKAKVEKFSGAVQKVDEMAKTVVVKGKTKEMTFALDEKTKITKAGKAMPLSNLKEGMQVSVQYKKDGDKMIATAIKAAVPKPAPKKEPAKPAAKPEEPKK